MTNDSTRELLVKLLKRREELRIESEALENLITAYTSLSRLQGVCMNPHSSIFGRFGIPRRRSRHM